MACCVWSGGLALLLLLFALTLSAAQTVVVMHNGVCAMGKAHVGLCVPLAACNELTSRPGYERGDEELYRCREAIRKDLYCCKVENYTVENSIVSAEQRANLLLEPPHCGRIVFVSRIAGGETTTITEYPWTVLLEQTDNAGLTKFACGASLINDRWVLTAAHCVLDPAKPVTGARLGEWNLDTLHDCVTEPSGKRDCNPPIINVGIDRIIAHPQYDKPNNFSNDIALLRLSFPVAFTETVRPICLPRHKALSESRLKNSYLDVVGWGRTGGFDLYSSIKMKAVLQVGDHNQCKATFAASKLSIDDAQFCARGISGASTCRGDSGGPLTAFSRDTHRFNHHYLAGVVSFGKLVCSTSDLPGVYTRVGAHMDWIEDMLLSNAD